MIKDNVKKKLNSMETKKVAVNWDLTAKYKPV